MNHDSKQDQFSRKGDAPGDHFIPGILIADDERGVLNLLEKTLTRLDLDVRLAQTGEDALLLAGNMGPSLCLAILDLFMPGLSGEQLIQQLRVLRPDIRILLMSGDDSASNTPELQGCLIDEIILKPFSLDQIRNSVSRHLQEMGLR